MKTIAPKPFYFTHQVCWEKPNFYAYFSVYAGVDFDKTSPETWLPQNELLQLIDQISQKSIFDNGHQRYQGECLVFCEGTDIGEISLRISDIYKKSPPADFLALPYSDQHYFKNQGSYNQKWLNTRWPAIAADHKKSAFQIAPDDQRSTELWSWDQAFEVKLDKAPSKIYHLSNQAIHLFSLDQADSFEAIELKLDLIWLIPEKKSGIIVGHGVKKVSDIDATDIEYLYLAETPFDQPLTLAAHKENFNQKIIAKQPSFEPTEMEIPPTISESDAEKGDSEFNKETEGHSLEDIAPEVPKIKSALAAKLSAIKEKYADNIDTFPKQKLPEALQSAIDEKDHEIAIKKVKFYVDNIMAGLQQKLNTQCPDQAKTMLNASETSVERIVSSLGDTISDVADKYSESLPKDAQAKLSKPDDIVKEVKKAIKTIDEYQPETPKEEKTDIIYSDCNFSHQDLSEIDFTGHDLTNSNFSHANLSGAIFNRTILEHTVFTHANLHEASFLDLAIIGADFSSALLKKAKFCRVFIKTSKFDNTYLSKSHLDNTHWHDCNLMAVNFSESCITDCNFQAGQYQRLNFEKSTIHHSIFNHIKFDDLNMNFIQWQESALMNCTVEHACFIKGKFTGFQCSDTIIKNADFSSAAVDKYSLSASDLFEVSFQSAELSGIRANHHTVFNHCNFSNANLSDAAIVESTLQDCLFEEMHLVEATFLQCVARKFNLNKSYLQDASFYGCDLSDSYFEKTNLFEAQIRNSNLENAVFIDSNLYGISFYLTNLKQAIFENNVVQDNFDLIKKVQAMECD